ncbi:MAG TPA: ABC transporter ATP-binding protein [Agitococcus sp.]|nr:ABC transporter ATP-binding protein [Agitococcus sp.]
MSSNSDIAISVNGLSKCYQIYNKPNDRLKQFFIPRMQSLLKQSVKQYYREFWALKDVSFEVKRGETVGIVGRNGSGKSTLLQLICGTLTPTAGQVSVNGRIAALLELGAGFNSEFSGRENIYLNGAILGINSKEMEKKVSAILSFSELGDFIEQPVKTYSSGMYSRLAFSIAIHIEPDILIVDEALAVGDARFVAKCMRKIKDIQNEGATVLFVSHDVSSVRNLCQRVIWLNQGQFVEEGDVFPVTGRFMEFMFKDEDAPVMLDLAKIEKKETAINGGSELFMTKDDAQMIDSRPVTHWGSHKGIVLSATISNEAGLIKDVYYWNERIIVNIQLKIPQDISRDYLSVAFSIKNLKGMDLIVSTTYDFSDYKLPDTDTFGVSFTFNNPLVTGAYLLVAAVENRQYKDTHYYEYIEGAYYFSSLSEQYFFGLFQPQIEKQIFTGN